MITNTLNSVRINIPKLLRHKPAMLFAELILTLKCSQRCLQCNIPDRGSLPCSTMDFEDFTLIADRLYDYGTHGIVLSGGEPCMHPDFFEILQYTIKKNFTYVHVLSNLFLSKSKVEKLAEMIVAQNIGITTSFDGLGSVADQIRGGKNVEKITVRNMKMINEAGKEQNRKLKTSANIVISQLNLHQIPEIIDLLAGMNWMINIDLYRNSSVNHNQVDEMIITDYEKLDAVLSYAMTTPHVVTPSWLLKGYLPFLGNNFSKQCPYIKNPGLGSKFFIQPDGEVRVCIGKPIGNLIQQEPVAIFDSEKWQKKQEEFEDCPGCWNTCYTPSAKISNYLNLKEVKNIINILKT